MQDLPSFSGTIAFSFIFLLIWAVTVGVSLLGSRVPLIIGLLLDLFSRGLFVVLWLVYIVSTVPSVKQMFEEFGIQLPGFTMLVIHAIPNYGFILFPLIIVAMLVNSTAFGLLHRKNKDLATIWTFVASTVTLICCSMTILAIISPLKSLLNGLQS